MKKTILPYLLGTLALFSNIACTEIREQGLIEEWKHKIATTPGLVAFWDWSSEEEGIWYSQGGDISFPLFLRRIGDTSTYSASTWPYLNAESKIQYDHSGPFGKAIRFNQGYIYGEVPRKYFDKTSLDIHGQQAFTLIAWVKFVGNRHMVAGVWDEGGWSKYAGRRQYALFAGLFGQKGVIAHLSSTGAASYPQSDINGAQYARIRAIDSMPFENHQWVAMAMSYDPEKDLIRAYLNGKTSEYHLNDPVTQSVFAYQKKQSANPYSFKGPIYSPSAMIIKYHGYKSEIGGINEHRLYVDLDRLAARYEQTGFSDVQDNLRILFDIKRKNTSILETPLSFLALPLAPQEIKVLQRPASGDTLITSMEEFQSDHWKTVGSPIKRLLQEGAPFTIGRALGLASEEIEHGSQLFVDGIAIFSRVLTDQELKGISLLESK